MYALMSITEYGAGNMLMNTAIFPISRRFELFNNFMPTALFRNAYNIVQTQYIQELNGEGKRAEF